MCEETHDISSDSHDNLQLTPALRTLFLFLFFRFEHCSVEYCIVLPSLRRHFRFEKETVIKLNDGLSTTVFYYFL